MVKVDLRQLIGKLNPYCSASLNDACGLAVSRTNYEVTPEHFLMKMLERPEGDLGTLLDNNRELIGSLMKELSHSLDSNAVGNGGRAVFSPRLLDLLSDAWLIASVDLGMNSLRSGAVILAILDHPMIYGQEKWFRLLGTLNPDRIRENFAAVTTKSVESAMDTPSAAPAQGQESQESGPAAGGFIDRFCNDFTKKARAGKIDPVFGRDAEIRMMVDILARRRKNNPILVGEPGVGKTAVIEGLALRIATGDVPDMLKDVSLIELDMARLSAGAGMKGEFENRLRGVIQEIQGSLKPIILFIDEAHTLIGAGGSAGTGDAANLLKPALARGELRTCAATTWSEYKKYFEKDPALARRFQLVKLPEPTVETAALILRGLRASYEKAHHVVIRDDALDTAAELADRYITARFLPDKAIDLLDTACARVKVNLRATPGAVEDLLRHCQALERRIASLKRDLENDSAGAASETAKADAKILEELNEELTAVRAEHAKAHEEWQQELKAVNDVVAARERLDQALKTAEAGVAAAEPTAAAAPAQTAGGEEDSGSAPALTPDEARKQLGEAAERLKAIQGDNPKLHYEVTGDLVAQVVSDWTGVPLGRMARDEISTVLNLREILSRSIRGQDFALSSLATAMRNAKSGLRNPCQPLGVFLLVGPSGVGKSQTAITLAEQLFGSQRSLVTVNMSEYQEKHTVSRLVGSPPGYVGYGEGGVLTEAVRQQPYSVVLLDEVEKAHPDILNIFYQVFDKGVLSDGEGKEINFSNTVILLTSNLATDIITEMCADPDCTPEALNEAIRPLLNNHFKPALLARMTVLPYQILKPEALREIAGLKLGKLAATLKENNGVKLTWTPEIEAQIADRCKDAETGARNVDFIINVNLLPRLSSFVLERMGQGGAMPECISISLGDDGDFALAAGEAAGAEAPAAGGDDGAAEVDAGN